MEILRTFGHYSIVSEKIDKCPCKYNEYIILMSMGFVTTLFFIALLQTDDLIYFIVFNIIGFIGCFGGLYISDSLYNCGVEIKLKDNNYIDVTIKSKLFQLTSNPNRDALEIKNIMDNFEKYANKIDIVNKKREDEEHMKSKLCCNKYKSVIQKVK
jgi:hypothetical protein